ncbi:DUF2339 domain-containing protein [Planifilum fimeticola]
MEWLVIIGLIFYLIHDRRKTDRMEREIEELKRELAAYRHQSDPGVHAENLPEDGRQRTAGNAAKPPHPVSGSLETQAKKTSPSPDPVKKSEPAAPLRPAPGGGKAAPAPAPRRSRSEWEQLIGGKWLNRIGAFALILGIGFFLKYAFDNNLIPEWMRVLIGFLVGAALLVAGGRFSKRGLPIFAQGLVGAGIAILYLSVYASFNFYHLVPQTVALLGMSGVTVLAFQQAMRHHSLAVSMLGWSGGYLTPFLLSTGEAQSLGLLTYLALLTAGLLLVIRKREQWIVLLPLTFIATYLVFTFWRSEMFSAEETGIALAFIAIYWGLFHGLDLWCWLKRVTSHAVIRRVVSFFNALFFTIIVYDLMNFQASDWTAAALLLIGMAYGGSFLMTERMKPFPKPIRGQLSQCLFIAAALVVLATLDQFSGYTLTVLWGLEACLMAFWGIYKKQRSLWLTALGLFGLIPLQLAYSAAVKPIPPADFTPLLNGRALASAATAGALGAGAYIYRRLKGTWAVVPSILHLTWCIVLFVWLTGEVHQFFEMLMLEKTGIHRQLFEIRKIWSIVGAWLVYALLLTRIGLRKKNSPLVFVGFGAMVLALGAGLILGWFFYPIALYTPLFNVRFFLLGLSALAVYLMGRWLRGEKKFHFKGLPIVISFVIGFILFQMLTAETLDYYRQAVYLLEEQGAPREELIRLSNRLQLTLSMVWILYSLALMAVGIWRRKQGARMMAIGLFGLTILKLFLFDLSFLETLYRIISFIVLGLILIGVSYVYSRYKGLFMAPEKDDSATDKTRGLL